MLLLASIQTRFAKTCSNAHADYIPHRLICFCINYGRVSHVKLFLFLTNAALIALSKGNCVIAIALGNVFSTRLVSTFNYRQTIEIEIMEAFPEVRRGVSLDDSG